MIYELADTYPDGPGTWRDGVSLSDRPRVAVYRAQDVTAAVPACIEIGAARIYLTADRARWMSEALAEIADAHDAAGVES